MRKLKWVRESLGMSAAELSRRAAVHPSDLSRCERGELLPYPCQRTRIADAIREAGGDANGLFDEAAPDA